MKTAKTILLGATLLLDLAVLTIQCVAAPGDLDLSFNAGSGVSGNIRTIIVQPDGKVLIAGEFTSVNGVARTNIARLNANGSLENTFSGSGTFELAPGSVSCGVLQPDGKIIIADVYAESDCAGDWSFPATQIARLNTDGSLDTGFGQNEYRSHCGYVIRGVSTPGSVNFMTLQTDGKLFIAGGFGGVNSTEKGRIARLNTDGSVDNSFDAGLNLYDVYELYSCAMQADGKLLVGGYFRSIRGVARGIIRLNSDGSADTNFIPPKFSVGNPPQVTSIAVQTDGRVIIGGRWITGINGIPRQNIARLSADGTLDTSFDPGSGANDAVYSVVVQPDGKVLIGGSFSSVNGTARNGLARLNSDGSVDSSFNPMANYQAPIVLQPDGKVLTSANLISNAMHVVRLHNDYLLPRLEIDHVGNLPVLQLTGDVGQRYVLEYVSSLPAASNGWTALPPFFLTNNLQTLVDDTATNVLQRFYRARWVAP